MANTAFLPGSFRSPFTEVYFYYVLSLVLGVIILGLLYYLHLVGSRYALIPHTFATLMKIEKRRLYCYGVDVTLTPEARIIESTSRWVLRITVVTILFYIWQTCIQYQVTIHLPQTPDQALLSTLCESGLTCIYSPQAYNPLFPLISNQQQVKVCQGNGLQRAIGARLASGETLASIAQSQRESATLPPTTSNEMVKSVIGPRAATIFEEGFIMCLGIPRLDSLRLVRDLAISYALFHLIVGTYQLLCWLTFRSKTTIIPKLSLLLAIILTILYLVVTIVPGILGLDTWFATGIYFAVPIVLLCSRRTGLAIKAAARRQVAIAEDNPDHLGQLLETLPTRGPSFYQRARSDGLSAQGHYRGGRRHTWDSKGTELSQWTEHEESNKKSAAMAPAKARPTARPLASSIDSPPL